MRDFQELVAAELAYARQKHPERWTTMGGAFTVIATQLRDAERAAESHAPLARTWLVAELASLACACQRAAEDLNLLRDADGYTPPFTEKG